MESHGHRFAQTVDSSYYSRLPCGVLHVPSVACAFNVFIISDATGKVNSRRGIFHGSTAQKFRPIAAFFR